MKRKQLVLASTSGVTRSKKGKNNDGSPSTNAVSLGFEPPLVFKSRMTPGLLMEFINSNPSEKQLADIKEMGFDGLMRLKTDTVPGDLALWLVLNFDGYKSSMLDGKLSISDEDVHLATGIPMGPLQIIEASKKDKSDEFSEIVTNWKRQFPTNVSITKRMILNKLIEQRDGGQDFKRNFVVFVVSTFISGVKGVVPSLCILKCLKDVSDIPKLNWCLYTRVSMMDNIVAWKNNLRNGTPKAFKGPIMVLIFIYLDRFVFRSRDESRQFPTLAAWTKELISGRIFKEKTKGGGFGCGNIDAPFKKESQALPSTVKTLASAAKNLAEAFDTFNAAVSNAKSQLPNSEVVSQMYAMAESLLHGCTVPQKETAEEEKGLEIGVEEKEDKGEDKERSDDPGEKKVVDSQDSIDKFYDDPKVLAQIEAVELEAALKRLKHVFRPRSTTMKSEGEQPSCPQPSCPSFNLFEPGDPLYASQNQKCPTPECDLACGEALSTPECAPHIPLDNLESAMSPSLPLRRSPRLIGEVFKSSDLDHAPKSSNLLDHPPTSSNLEPEKRKPVVTQVFKSPFLQRNIDIFKDLTQLEKDVADYVCSDQLDKSQILYRRKEGELSRSDLKCLISEGKVSDKVIHIWCDLLNIRETFRSPQSPCRLYLSPTYAVNLEEVQCDKVALVLFPFTHPSRVLLCINIQKRKFEVVHTVAHETDPFDHLVSTVIDYMQQYDSIFPWCKSLWKYTVEHVSGSYVVSIDDAWISLMRLMEIYKGRKQDLIIKQRDSVRGVDTFLGKLKAKYCYSILSNDVNSLKEEIVIAARCFRANKSKRESVAFHDEELLDFVHSDLKSPSSFVIETDWLEVTRHAIVSLLPERPLFDEVIDAAGLYATVSIPDVLFLPSTMRLVDPIKQKNIRGFYVRLSYLPNDASKIKKVFLPLGEGSNHWFLCVLDLEKKKNFILDSLSKAKKLVRRQLATTTVSKVVEVISRSKGYEMMSKVSQFKYEYLDVPQQNNGFDCGLYVIKWIEALNDESLWKNPEYFSDLDEFRQATMMKLLRWDKNKIRVFA